MSEKLQILNMVKDGTITSEEGADLLEALDSNESKEVVKENTGSFLKVRVYDPNEDTKVNISLPVGLITIGLRMAEKFSPEFKEAGLSEDDINDILEAIKEGQMGKIVEVDSGDGTKVEVVIE